MTGEQNVLLKQEVGTVSSQSGLRYFSFDVDFFSDKKIRMLKARHGVKGVMLYIWLLCEIYKNGYYLKFDDDYEYLISKELNMSIGEIKQVMKFLAERSMFDNTLFRSDNIVTSPGIQKRFQLAIDGISKKSLQIVRKFWILSEEETQGFIKVTLFSDFNPKNNKNSENFDTKENKEKKEKNNHCRADDTQYMMLPESEKENKSKSNSETIKQIIDYLNYKTGKRFKATTGETKKHINARLREGFIFKDFKTVIDNKAEQWLNNSEMNKYLRPSTLFSPKFESYLNENIQNIRGKPERVINDCSSDFKEWSDEKLDDVYNSLH